MTPSSAAQPQAQRYSMGFSYVAAIGVVLACSEQVDVGRNLVGAGGASGTPGAGSSGLVALAGTVTGGAPIAGSPSDAGACEPRTCRGRVYACGDCVDNDADGAIDALDPECLGACDDIEEAYIAGIPGQSGTGCEQDCYFDRNSGGGNDRCSWDLRCDPLSPGAATGCATTPAMVDGPACVEARAGQPAACVTACGPLTPNGCDCFGCCELPARSGRFVHVGAADCDAAHLDDTETCPRCTPVLPCVNDCEDCEACVGGARPLSSCGGAPAECPDGLPACGAGASCALGAYCVTGCCVPVPR